MAAKLLLSIIARAVEPSSFTGKTKNAQRVQFPCISRGSIWSLPATYYMDRQWFWFESGIMKPWEAGWKRSPNPAAKNRDPRWLDKYPGRSTGL
jgi:hypothetical protein